MKFHVVQWRAHPFRKEVAFFSTKENADIFAKALNLAYQLVRDSEDRFIEVMEVDEERRPTFLTR